MARWWSNLARPSCTASRCARAVAPVDAARARSAPEAGTSLVELMLVSAVSVTLVMGILTGVAGHSRQRRVNSERMLAMMACRNTMEELRAVPIADVPDLSGRGFDVPGPGGEVRGLTARKGDADGLAGVIKVEVDQHVGANVLYRVTLRVDWTGVSGDRTLEFVGLLGERR